MKALVIGLGQDGRLMLKQLLADGLPFRSLIRRSSSSVALAAESGIPTENILSCSIISAELLADLHRGFAFTHIFNFAANSFVQASNDNFRDYIDANSGITWELLKFLKREPETWMMQPLSSEILNDIPRDEADLNRCIEPRNAYGLSKLVDLHSCAIERQVSGVRILSPIVYNHESRLRPAQFFSRKLLNYLQAGDSRPPELRIYNCASVRDWGSAPEYMKILLDAAARGLSGTPLLGTGYGLTVERFVDHTLDTLGLTVEKQLKKGLLCWRGDGLNILEVDRDPADAERVVIANREMVERFFGRAPQIFGADLVRELVHNEI
jgi:GDPmannose 4,6-dehydratase|tara:strand:- start:90 stop:1061 length:972 start_codon:yes stop_codon:yes gene_type:complete